MNSFTILFVACLTIGTQGLPTSRVIDGYEAPDGAYPYMVSLQYKEKHNCGGSIINEYYVLTAAHCVFGIRSTDLSVLAGTNSLTSQGQLREVDGVVISDSYHPDVQSYDIALVRVKEPFVFNDKVKPVKLASNSEPNNAVFKTVLTGWGLVSVTGKKTDKLQEINLDVMDHDVCMELFEDIVNSSHICTSTEEGSGACEGDSGGPLVSENGEQVGIVSFGVPCAVGAPDVYTRVSFYHGWIQRNMY